MADISKMNVNGTEYNIKDATARAAICKQYEFERNVTQGGVYNKPSTWAIGFNRVYNGKKLDFDRVRLTGQIGYTQNLQVNPYYVNFICHDITRQIQSIQDGQKLGFPLSGVFRPYVDNPTIEFYSFSCDVYREGDAFRINVRNLLIGSKTTDSNGVSRDWTFFEGMVCRTILTDYIEQI